MTTAALETALAETRGIVKRAEKDTKRLDGMMSAWISNKTSATFRKRNLSGSKYLVEVVFGWEEIPALYVETASSIITALANGAISLFEALGASVPATRSDSEFEAGFISRIVNELPESYRPVVEALDPDHGGNGEPLRAIFELVGRDEDQLLEVSPAPDRVALTKFARARRIRFTDSAFDSANKSLVLFEAAAGREFHHDFKVPLQIVFRGIHVGGCESATTLLLDACDNIIEVCEGIQGTNREE